MSKGSLEIEYVEAFGSDEAEKLVRAAQSHNNATCSEDHGNDPFIWAIITAIDFRCVSDKVYARQHGIKITWDEFKNFCIKHKKRILDYTGDFGWLGLLCGAYNFLMEDEQ